MPSNPKSGKVKFFKRNSGYGFIALDAGGRIFFSIRELLKAGMETISKDVSVIIEPGSARDGRSKVWRFLEIGGNAVVPGRYEVVDGKFVMVRNEPGAVSPQLGHVPPPTSSDEEILPPARSPMPVYEPEPTPSKAPAFMPSVQHRPRAQSQPEDGIWENGKVKRIQPGRGGYVVLNSGAQVAVSAAVMDTSGLRNLKKGQSVRVRIPRGSHGDTTAKEIARV